jgi:hypothetical protein
MPETLEYGQPDYGKPPSKEDLWRPNFRSAVPWLVALAAVLLSVYFIKMSRSRARFNETSAFRDLAQLAREMIDSEEPGTAIDGRVGYIVSFDAFFDYVAAHHPSYVSSRDADNPFAGLLPGDHYPHAKGRLSKPNELLIWNSEAFRGNTTIQMRLTCNGRDYASVDTGPLPPRQR